MSRLSVLQLDTNFPRIPGDVGCEETYHCELEIIRVPNASVEKVVTNNPDEIDLQPFQKAISQATGDLIVTSCGFLAPFQSQLEVATRTPFIASALSQLELLKDDFLPSELKILTFDSTKLSQKHLPKDCALYEPSIYGLEQKTHLRDVISNDLPTLDIEKAAKDICTTLTTSDVEYTKAILLECTNLPPYKPALRKIKDVPIYDILTAIEAILPGCVKSEYL